MQAPAWFAAPGSITDVAGIEVGQYSEPRRPTGCSVVIARAGAVGAVDVRGAAPGTRETDLLAPGHLVQQVHAVVLAGGSAWGLDAASGAMRWLEEQGVGLEVGLSTRLPLVPAAVLFDLQLGDARIRPDASAGYAACQAASRLRPAEGSVGAGSGATVGKLFGLQHAMKGGIGTAAVQAQGVTVGALIACNAVGDVLAPDASPLAGARRADGSGLRGSCRALLAGEPMATPLAGRNTTIGVIATDALLDKAQAQRLAVAGHDGLARSIAPVHTAFDGDALFTLATGASGLRADPVLLASLAAEAVARATLRSVWLARGLRTPQGLYLPGLADK